MRVVPVSLCLIASICAVLDGCGGVSVLSEGAVVRLVRNKRHADWFTLWRPETDPGWASDIGSAVQRKMSEYWTTLNSLTEVDSTPIQHAIETAQSYVDVALDSLRNSRSPALAPVVDE